MATEWMIQYTQEFQDGISAANALEWLHAQIDYKGGRTLPPSDSRKGWLLQAFFEDAAPSLPNNEGHAWYPDGIKRVVILPSLRAALGIGA